MHVLAAGQAAALRLVEPCYRSTWSTSARGHLHVLAAGQAAALHLQAKQPCLWCSHAIGYGLVTTPD
eukprot:1161245-Pelagomonas_calceolata.AAC.4